MIGTDAADNRYDLIMPQPLSLLLLKPQRIDIFKLNQMALNPLNQSCQAPPGTTFGSVLYDIQSAGVLLATSTDRTKLLLYEAKGKGSTFACKLRRQYEVDAGMKINKVLLINGLLYVSFLGESFVSITQYQPKNVI